MHFLAIARIEWVRHRLITVPGIRALVIDLHDHTRSHGEPVGGVPITLGRDVPALAATFADAGDYAGGGAVGSVVAEVRAARVSEVVRGREAGAVVACCGWATGYSGAAGGVPGEGGGEDGVRV
ncbi:MAG: hypothetical protein ASARMPREDX12_008806 [Alectoria sarmentosa]|nr:MAG: hypothetical protein ASARMPREDX12_008806 [Alectoria sarmentosa]